MLLKIGLALLVVWLVAVLAFQDLGDLKHVLLLLGLMLSFLGALKARDASAAAARDRASS